MRMSKFHFALLRRLVQRCDFVRQKYESLLIPCDFIPRQAVACCTTYVNDALTLIEHCPTSSIVATANNLDQNETLSDSASISV